MAMALRLGKIVMTMTSRFQMLVQEHQHLVLDTTRKSVMAQAKWIQAGDGTYWIDP